MQPAAELQRVVATLIAPERLDLIESHDGRSMHAHESLRIKAIFEYLHLLADEVRLLGGMNFRVRSAGSDVQHLGDGHDAHLPAAFDGDALEVSSRRSRRRSGRLRRCCSSGRRAGDARTALHCLQRGEQLRRMPPNMARFDRTSRAAERLVETIVVVRLDEIVERRGVEGLQRVLVICCYEYGHRHRVDADRADHVEARAVRHLDIEEHHIRCVHTDRRDRFGAAGGRRDDDCARFIGQQIRDASPGQRLVIDDQYAHRAYAGHAGTTPSKSSVTRRAIGVALSVTPVVRRSPRVW